MSEKFPITFLNEPKLSGHEVDKVLDEGRVFMVPKIEEFISSHPLFNNEQTNISFFHTGVSSLVSLLESPTNKYILKVKLRKSDANMESTFLKKWESIGIKVPHVYEDGEIEGYNYTLMEYIEADILNKKYTTDELIEKNVFFEMGQILQKIHTVETTGFGHWDKEENAKFNSFSEWLLNDTNIQNQLSYAKENNLLPEEIFGTMEMATNKLISYLNENNQSTYCHFDYSPGNVLDTDPITVFDPACIINNPYIDLAKSLVQSLSHCPNYKVAEQIIDGYFKSKKQEYNKEILKYSLLFAAYTKFPYWHKKNKTKQIDFVKDYIRDNYFI